MKRDLRLSVRVNPHRGASFEPTGNAPGRLYRWALSCIRDSLSCVRLLCVELDAPTRTVRVLARLVMCLNALTKWSPWTFQLRCWLSTDSFPSCWLKLCLLM